MAKKPEKSVKKNAKPKKEEPPTTSSSQIQNGQPEASGIWKDARFQHLLTDPRFRGVPKVQRKVKIDKRFQGMFDDDKFKVKYTVDKYGRPVNKSNAEDLRKFYELDDNESSDEDEDKDKESNKEKETSEDDERRAEELAIARDELKLDSDDETEVPENLRERLTNPNVDYARGEGRLMTDSSSDEDSDEDGEDEGPELQIDHVWGELDMDAECTEESSRRLAVCNMDWDRIRAQDLMVLLSSFLPPGGSILSVKIYPSEYGKARMAEEDVHGPTELLSSKPEADSDLDSDEELVREQDSDAEEGDDYHMEKLRQYQLNRLRYYYAVVECDSISTADKVYKECDGIEYESSATRVDLRFIPDDTSFDEDMPTDECYELPDASSYKPRQFTTTALQQAKVDLTWDETALDRRELGDKLSSGKVDQLNDKELRQIVAYSSEEDDDDDEEEVKEPKKETEAEQAQPDATAKKPSKRLREKERIEKYKNLLAEINAQEKQSKEKNYEMEMSWNVETSDKPSKDAKESAISNKSQMTPIEQVLQKRSEKNKQRKEQRRRKQLELKGIDPDAAQNSDDDSIPDGIDMNDSYFADEFANGDYEKPKQSNKSQSKMQKHIKSTPDEAEAEAQAEAQLALLLDDDDDIDLETQQASGKQKQHFSLAKILKDEQQNASSKRKRRKQLKKSKTTSDSKPHEDDNFQVDLNDSRFKAVYKSHEYNIDPTNSNYKATKGMQQLIGEKFKRRQQQQDDGKLDDGDDEAPAQKRSKQQLETSALVKSLKRKIQQRKV
ncbi:pre-rRNA-processing protein esf1 [Drosophila innubila]|uniref:pre-rRNA-processing protein esf1 n=1 Tax=Drosophila innubila TaxID=198719 RepID=UPI00148DDFBA|nr:pre-rRNA-processing protein esf1 [Drosophila innubila]